MPAFSKFLVLLAIFLLANLGDTFINLSSAAGNLVRVNHLIRFVESMRKPTNEPSRVLTCKPANDWMNDQISNEKIQWLKQDVLLPDNLSKRVTFSDMGEIKIQSDSPDLSQTQLTSNTSYAFEAVNGVNHDHNKIIVNIWVTFKDQRDSEIRSEIREQSKTQSDWQGSKQRSFIKSARVPFATFCSNLSSGLNCWDHSHTGREPVTLMHGLRHDKNSEQVRGNTSTQQRGLCPGKKSEQAGCIAST